jgi:hypothetical protein
MLWLLMLVPAGDVSPAISECVRLTCKYREHTVGFPSGSPPTPKLEEGSLERNKLNLELVSKKT